jgi:hypothetical protein
VRGGLYSQRTKGPTRPFGFWPKIIFVRSGGSHSLLLATLAEILRCIYPPAVTLVTSPLDYLVSHQCPPVSPERVIFAKPVAHRKRGVALLVVA